MALLNPSKKTTKKTSSSGSSSTKKVLTGIDASKLTSAQRAKLSSGGYTTTKQSTAPKKTSVATPINTPVSTQKTPVTPKSTYVAPTSNTGKAVKSYFGNALGTNLGFNTKPKQTFEFDVLPGSKNAGIKAFEMPSSVSAQSTMDAARTQQQQAKLNSDVKAGQVGSFVADVASIPALALAGGPVGPDDAANYARLSAKYGSKAETLWSGIKSMGSKGKQYLDNLLSTKKDDLTANVIDSVDNIPKPPSPIQSVSQAVTRQIASHPVISTLGALVATTAAIGVGSSYSGAVRSATTPSTATSTPTTTATSTPTTTTAKTTTPETTESKTTDVQTDIATQSFSTLPASDTSYMTSSVASAPSSGVSGGSTGGVSGVGAGTSKGGAGAGYGVGEPITDNLTAAQMKAMELQRQQQQKDAGVVPIGDEVDIATLASARDNARALLDQYGAEAITMPEYKNSIQTLLAGNLANLNKMQPPVPDPVIDTVEQSEFLDGQGDQASTVRAFMDDTRKKLGMTDMETQRIDVMKQLQAVQETYQLVIDDIKENPNLPKGLAARRLTEVFEDQKFAANTLIAQLEQIDQQLSDANDRLNLEFGIFKEEQDALEKQQARRADQFGYMVDSGAVAALSDKEIRQWASATGIPESAIKSMKEKATTPDKSYDISYETNEITGEKFAVYSDKNDPLATPTVVSLGNFGVKPTSGGGKSTKETIYSTKNLPGDVRSDILSDLNNQQFLKDYPDRTSAVIALSNMYQEVDMDTLGDMYDQFVGEVVEEDSSGDGWFESLKKITGKVSPWW